MESLAKMLAIEDRFGPGNDFEGPVEMNFDEINKRMEDLRNDGINVLEEFQLGV